MWKEGIDNGAVGGEGVTTDGVLEHVGGQAPGEEQGASSAQGPAADDARNACTGVGGDGSAALSHVGRFGRDL